MPEDKSASLNLADLLKTLPLARPSSPSPTPKPSPEPTESSQSPEVTHKGIHNTAPLSPDVDLVPSTRICIEYSMTNGKTHYESRCFFKDHVPFVDLLEASIQAEARLTKHEFFTSDDGTWVISKHIVSVRFVKPGDLVVRGAQPPV